MLPRIITHTGVSLDGRVTGFEVDVGLYYELAMGWGEDATLVGADTLLTAPDDEVPEETPEAFEPRTVDPEDPRSIIVIPDSRGRLRNWHYWPRTEYWKDAVAMISASTPDDYVEHLRERHIDTIVAGDDHVDLRKALEELNRGFGVETVRVDSGGTLFSVLLREGLVSEVSLLVHPVVVGGGDENLLFKGEILDDAILPDLELLSIEEKRNGILWLKYDLKG